MNSNHDTTGPGSSETSSIDTEISVTSISEVDSMHTTDDFHRIDKELEAGEVVVTKIDSVTGDFATDAVMTSATQTDVNGVIHTAFGGGSSGGMTTSSEGANDLTFHDWRRSTMSTEASQSGAYGDGEEDASSSNFSVTSADEYYSDYEGTSHFEDDGIVQDVTFERHIDGDSTRVFSDNKSFSHLGRTASWSTSFNSNLDWNSHAEITEFGYTIVVDDSGSETKSESSGEHTYEPGEGEDPSGSYRPKGQDGGGGSGEGGGGDLEDGELGDMVRSSPAFDLFTQFMRPHWEKSHGDFVNVPHIINPGDPAPTAMNLKWYDWMRDEAKPLFVNAGEGDETFAPVPSLWKGQILEQKIPIVGYRNGENTLADRQTRANIDGTYKRPPNTTWHHVTFLL